jgi:hypothetical protein
MPSRESLSAGTLALRYSKETARLLHAVWFRILVGRFAHGYPFPIATLSAA